MHAKVLLVTGFGRFPGAPFNPTERIVAALGGGFARRLARLGWRLERRILPVVWTDLPGELARLDAALRPDAVLHLGLAGRRRTLTVETRAHNRRRPLSCDADGRRADAVTIEPGGAFARPARVDAPRLVVAMRRATPASASNDAGAYLCNLALWESLGRGGARPVVFVHVPGLRRTSARRGARKPGMADMIAAARLACLGLIARPRVITGS
jgi:pyroglutamyl-peptidase